MQVLGERGEIRAAQMLPGGRPHGITRGLYYPDRRVQFAAMKAMLKMPLRQTPAVASARIVELSKRFLAASPAPKALVAYAPIGQEQMIRKTLQDLGSEPDPGKQVKQAIEKGQSAADYDLVILHRGMKDADFSFVYGQLRQGSDIGGLPMVVVVSKAREKAVQKFVARDANVIVVPEEKFDASDDMKDLLAGLIRKLHYAKLSAAERKEFAKVSMDTLWRMARGEITGYSVMPALDVIMDQLGVPDNDVMALEILGR